MRWRVAPAYSSPRSEYAPSCSHDSEKKPFGDERLHAVTLAGSVYACPNVPIEKAAEKITAQGESVHKPGEAGLR